jgi:predicted AlkP superfamily pyrophosphatase or phosphodiesterase
MRSRFVFVAVLLAASAFKPQTRPEQRNAVLISWDGASREHVRGNIEKGKLPNLARLAREGALVDIEVTGHGTDTKPGHAQMLTGYDPNLTGVYSNSKFGPIPRGYSIFERLREAFGKEGVATIMLTGKAANLGSQGPDTGFAREPFFLVRQGITVWDGDRIRSANAIGDKALRYIDRYAGKGRFFLFVHFPDVDVAGHTHGEESSEYDRALAECDSWLGRIMAELESQGIAERTLVYLSADHGFDPGTKRHTAATHIFLGTNDAKVRTYGEQRDIAPTVLSAMGVDLSKITPRLPGKVLAK